MSNRKICPNCGIITYKKDCPLCKCKENSMKAWTLNSGRPIGRHPCIYLEKPKQMPITDPWIPTIEEWGSVEEAFKAVFQYCHYKDYRDKIRVISEIDKDEYRNLKKGAV